MHTPMIDFAGNLRRLRKESGLSRAALAKKISYSEKSIEKWESGAAVPSVNMLCQLAQLFHVSLDSLVYPLHHPIAYFLGIDGGGTKTAFFLQDREGKLLRQLSLSSSNPNDVGIDRCQAILDQGIREICQGLPFREISMFAGLAGSKGGNTAQILREFFAAFGFGRSDIGSDMDTALALGLQGQDGMIVILGTGNVALAQKNGVQKRIGGWGYLLDSGGSGYNLGRDALEAGLCAWDGRGQGTILQSLLEEALGKSIPEAIPEIYRGGKRLIAGFAPLVFSAVDQGDEIALEILKKNVAYLARLIGAGMDFLQDPALPIALMGGLCHRGDLFLPMLQNLLPQATGLHINLSPMAEGAILLARKEIESC